MAFAIDWYGGEHGPVGWRNLGSMRTSTQAILLAASIETNFSKLTRVRDTASGRVVWRGRCGIAYMRPRDIRAAVLTGDE